MIDKTQLRFVLRLLEDDSPPVRRKVDNYLAVYGPGLMHEIAALHVQLTPQQTQRIAALVAGDALRPDQGMPALAATASPAATEFLKANWLRWMTLSNDYSKLETALALLAGWQLPQCAEPGLGALLDALAAEFAAGSEPADAKALAAWLFGQHKLRGVCADDYYNPLNSNLIYVVTRQQGIPISLTAIFMLVGNRLGMAIEGCNFPGHFLARGDNRDSAEADMPQTLFDCFDDGRALSMQEARAVVKAAPVAGRSATTAEEMVARFLRNLAVAYQQASDKENTLFVLSLLHQLESAAGRRL